MKTVVELEEILKQVKTIAYPLISDDAVASLEQSIDEFTKKKEETKYIKVPFIGVFTAGKSSLMNIICGRPGLLPTDLLPETAISYEMYYDTHERVVLKRNGITISETALKDIATLDTEPGDVAEVYIASEGIKYFNDRSIVLVDMPGIGSAIERHNAAVYNYLSEGTVFVLLIPAENGSIDKTSLQFIEELSRYELPPAVIVTKTDLVDSNTLKDVIDEIAYQLNRAGISSPIGHVCAAEGDIQGFYDLLGGIDGNLIKAVRLSGTVKHVISVALSALIMSKEAKSRCLDNIDKDIDEIDRMTEEYSTVKSLDDADVESVEKSTGDVLSNVRTALRAHSEELAMILLKKGGENELNSKLESIVRQEIVISLSEEREQYAGALSQVAAEVLKHLTGTEDDSIWKMIEDNSAIFDRLSDLLPEDYRDIAKTILVYIPILREWLEKLFGSEPSEEKVTEISIKLREDAIPKVITSLEPKVKAMITRSQLMMREQIQRDMDHSAKQYRDELKAQSEEKGKSREELHNELTELFYAIEQINELHKSI